MSGRKEMKLIRWLITCVFLRYPDKFLNEISMEGDQFWTDVYALVITVALLRVCAYFLLRAKLMSVR